MFATTCSFASFLWPYDQAMSCIHVQLIVHIITQVCFYLKALVFWPFLWSCWFAEGTVSDIYDHYYKASHLSLGAIPWMCCYIHRRGYNDMFTTKIFIRQSLQNDKRIIKYFILLSLAKLLTFFCYIDKFQIYICMPSNVEINVLNKA